VKLDPVVYGKKQLSWSASPATRPRTGVPGVYPPLAGSEWVNGSETASSGSC